jgi:hypothetical protein
MLLMRTSTALEALGSLRHGSSLVDPRSGGGGGGVQVTNAAAALGARLGYLRGDCVLALEEGDFEPVLAREEGAGRVGEARSGGGAASLSAARSPRSGSGGSGLVGGPPFVILPLDACQSGTTCMALVRAFYDAAGRWYARTGSEGGGDASSAASAGVGQRTRRPMLLIPANMAIVAPAQVSFARRCVDEFEAELSSSQARASVGGSSSGGGADGRKHAAGKQESGDGRPGRPQATSLGGGGVGWGGAAGSSSARLLPTPAVHAVLLLHLAPEQMRFRPIYSTPSCDWQAVFDDDWGLEEVGDDDGDDSENGNGVSGGTPEPTAWAAADEDMDPTPWLRMIFGISTPDTAQAAAAALRARVQDQVQLGL